MCSLIPNQDTEQLACKKTLLDIESRFQTGIHFKVTSFDADKGSDDDWIDTLFKQLLSNVKKKENSHAMEEQIVGIKHTR